MRPSLRELLVALVVATAAIAVFSPAFRPARSSLSVLTFEGPTMGTAYQCSVVSSRVTQSLQQAVGSRLAEINRQMSTYDAESELSQFNQHETETWFSVSHETAEVVRFALEIAKATDGAFDPTVGPAVNLWGFGPEGRRRDPPSDDAIAQARQRIGYQQVEVRIDPPALRKTNPQVYVDLSAVAKGYASDEIGRLLQEQGVSSYMVEIGGEVATRGTKPDGAPWRIGIEKPDSAGRSIQMVVELSGDAVATSGDYRNFFQLDGTRYSHTIDPTTSRPVTHNLATVTVRADTCMEADALATALLVMGPERGYDWSEDHDIAAFFVERSDCGPIERTTSAWAEQLAAEANKAEAN